MQDVSQSTISQDGFCREYLSCSDLRELRVEEVKERFWPHQIQGAAVKPETTTGRAKLFIAQSEPAGVIVHLDQPEEVLALNFQLFGHEQNEIQVNIEGYGKHGQWRHLGSASLSEKSTFLKTDTNIERFVKAIRIRIDPGRQPAGTGLSVSVTVNKSIAQRIYRELNRKGVLARRAYSNRWKMDRYLDSNEGDQLRILRDIDQAQFAALLDTPAQAREEAVLAKYEAHFFAPRYFALNRLGEPVNDGVTLFVYVMNRTEDVKKNLRNWLDQSIDEFVLLDWSSTLPVLVECPELLQDKRVRVVRVAGAHRFQRTLAQNIAVAFARYNRVFKADADIIFKGDFFNMHPLPQNAFYVGDWMQARTQNEKFVHGSTYFWRDDYLSVNGYDERIETYGYDDTDLMNRMCLHGLEKLVFNYDSIYHVPHAFTRRSSNQVMKHPEIQTQFNRELVNRNPLWCGYYRTVCDSLSIAAMAPNYFRVHLQDQGEQFATAERREAYLATIERMGRWWFTDAAVKSAGATTLEAMIIDKLEESNSKVTT